MRYRRWIAVPGHLPTRTLQNLMEHSALVLPPDQRVALHISKTSAPAGIRIIQDPSTPNKNSINFYCLFSLYFCGIKDKFRTGGVINIYPGSEKIGISMGSVGG